MNYIDTLVLANLLFAFFLFLSTLLPQKNDHVSHLFNTKFAHFIVAYISPHFAIPAITYYVIMILIWSCS